MVSTKTAKTSAPSPKGDGGGIEEHVLAFAEQIGFLVGTVQARTEGWLDRDRLNHAVGQIRDSAAQLLEQLNAKQKPSPKVSVKTAAASSTIRTRGLVDAPGKRHRKPPPQDAIDKRLNKAQGDRMTEKGLKTGRFRRRG